METFVHSHPHFYPSINVLQLKLVFAMKRVVAVGKHMPAGGKGRTEVGIGDGGWGKLSIEGVFSGGVPSVSPRYQQGRTTVGIGCAFGRKCSSRTEFLHLGATQYILDPTCIVHHHSCDAYLAHGVVQLFSKSVVG